MFLFTYKHWVTFYSDNRSKFRYWCLSITVNLKNKKEFFLKQILEIKFKIILHKNYQHLNFYIKKDQQSSNLLTFQYHRCFPHCFWEFFDYHLYQQQRHQPLYDDVILILSIFRLTFKYPFGPVIKSLGSVNTAHL